MTNREALEILKIEITSLLENPWITVDNKLVEAYNVTIKTLEERPQGRWIPVSERLPDNETEVLIQFGYSQSMIVGYHILDLTIYPSEFKDQNETGWYDSNDDFIGGTYEATAWMPLPEPYKEDDAENVNPSNSI